MTEIKIGDTFFVYDMNNRVYEKDEKGNSKGGPTFRGYFVPVTITGETSQSWVTSRYGDKVSKKKPFDKLYTNEMIDDAEWINNNRFKISADIINIKDINKLKQIAEIIGHVE